MKLRHRKSRLQRLLDTAEEVLDTPNLLERAVGGSRRTLKLRLPGGKALNAGFNQDTAVKVGVAATSLAALTAGSAGISELRRRTQGAGDHS